MSHAPPPTPDWAPQPQASGSSPRVIAGMVIGALIFGAGCGSGVLVGWLGGVASGGFDGLDGWDGDLTPEAAIGMGFEGSPAVGAPFELKVTITETGGHSQQFHTLDLNGAITEYFDISSVVPEPTETFSEFGWREYTYDAVLLPNEELTFTFTLVPKTMGIHSGTIDAYLDDWNSVSLEIAIPVGPPG